MTASAGDSRAIAPTLRGYRAKWLPVDLVTGVTLAAIFVPGQIAIAHLAGMPPTAGLYGTAAACVVIAVLARNRFLVAGCDSTLAPLLAAGVAAVAATGSPNYVPLVIATTFLTGVILLAVGIARLGWVADFLSRPIVTGFMAGVGITIIVDQLPQMLGVPGGSGHVPERLAQVVAELGQINWPTVCLGVVSLALLLIASRLSARIPGAFLVLVVAIGAVGILGLANDGVATLGDLPSGLPPIGFPDVSLDNIRLVLPTAVACTLIALAQTAATSRSSAERAGFDVDVNSDFRAMGLSNVASSAVGGFTVNASPSGTAMAQAMGTRSQIVSLVCGAVMVAFVLFLSNALHDLPMATLAAILVFISIKIIRVSEMRAMLQFSWMPFALMAVTLLGVVVLGVELGVLVAVVLAVVDRTRRTTRPELLPLVLGPTGQWQPATAETSPGDSPASEASEVIVYRLNGPLWYGNANWFKQQILAALPPASGSPNGLPAFVLDASGIDDMDYTGACVLRELVELCESRSVSTAIVVVPGRTQRALLRSQLSDILGQRRLYDSVEGAVAGVR